MPFGLAFLEHPGSRRFARAQLAPIWRQAQFCNQFKIKANAVCFPPRCSRICVDRKIPLNPQIGLHCGTGQNCKGCRLQSRFSLAGACFRSVVFLRSGPVSCPPCPLFAYPSPPGKPSLMSPGPCVPPSQPISNWATLPIKTLARGRQPSLFHRTQR